MAFARDSYTASASQTDFTITFPYLAATDVYVSVDGTTIDNDADADTSSYQIISNTTVRIGAGLTGGEVVVILRKTSQSSRLVDYASASTLTEEDLDNDSLQAFYMAQEAIDSAGLALNLGTNDQFDAVGLQINEVADPTAAQDAATKEYVDEVLVASGNVPSASETEDGDHLTVTVEGTIAWTDVEIATAEIEDEAVTSAKIEDGAVDEEHFAEEAVATADIADAAVTAAKLDAEIAGISAEGGSEGQSLLNEEGTAVAWGTPASSITAYTAFSTGDLTNGGSDDLTTLTVASSLSGVREFTLYIAGISTNSANTGPILQLGSGGLKTSGYTGRGATDINAIAPTSNSKGFRMSDDTNFDAANVGDIVVRCWHIGSNRWVFMSMGIDDSGAYGFRGVGLVTLAGALDQIEITTEAGTATFDGGTVDGGYLA